MRIVNEIGNRIIKSMVNPQLVSSDIDGPITSETSNTLSIAIGIDIRRILGIKCVTRVLRLQRLQYAV